MYSIMKKEFSTQDQVHYSRLVDNNARREERDYLKIKRESLMHYSHIYYLYIKVYLTFIELFASFLLLLSMCTSLCLND